MIRFDAITLFPEMFAAVTQSGITSRALEKGLWQFNAWNPRDFTTDNYRTIDDRPYGGGPGMVMLAEPLEKAIAAVKAAGGGRVIYLSPQGARLDHKLVMSLAAEPALTLLCAVAGKTAELCPPRALTVALLPPGTIALGFAFIFL